MESADVYMLLLRKTTLAPVFGEFIEPTPFFGQIVLDGWEYKLTNPRQVGRAGESGDLENPERLISQIQALNRRNDDESRRRSAELSARLQRLQQRNQQSLQRQAQQQQEENSEAPEDNNPLAKAQQENLTFKFKKRFCTATTQMLSMMKSGVPFQSALITIVARAGIWSQVPGFLSVMLTDVYITKYNLSCEQDENVTEINEDWECLFKHMTFKYFRRSDAPYGNVAQKVHQGVLAGQGGIQFVMMPRPWMIS